MAKISRTSAHSPHSCRPLAASGCLPHRSITAAGAVSWRGFAAAYLTGQTGFAGLPPGRSVPSAREVVAEPALYRVRWAEGFAAASQCGRRPSSGAHSGAPLLRPLLLRCVAPRSECGMAALLRTPLAARRPRPGPVVVGGGPPPQAGPPPSRLGSIRQGWGRGSPRLTCRGASPLQAAAKIRAFSPLGFSAPPDTSKGSAHKKCKIASQLFDFVAKSSHFVRFCFGSGFPSGDPPAKTCVYTPNPPPFPLWGEGGVRPAGLRGNTVRICAVVFAGLSV